LSFICNESQNFARRGVQMNVDKLRGAIVRALKASKPSGAKVPPATRESLQWLTPIIEAEALRHDLLRKHDVLDGCDDCLEVERLRKAKVLGNGAFGTVFDVGKGRCIKVERVRDAGIAQGVCDAVRMGELRVGVRVHKWHMCECAGSVYLVTEMDRVDGATLQAWLNVKSRKDADIRKLQAALKRKIARMKGAGVVHHDLHPGNVMVDMAGVPWIIDFTYDPPCWALYAIERRLGSDRRVSRVVAHLLESGAIVAGAQPPSVVLTRLVNR
jgi:hypothetical protein